MRFPDPRVPAYEWLLNNKRKEIKHLRAKLREKRRADSPDAWAAVEGINGLLGRTDQIPSWAVRQVLKEHGVLTD